jgi:hypothetical protein
MDKKHDEPEIEEELDRAESPACGSKRELDFFGALGFLIFALCYLVFAFGIKDFSTVKWYESAGLFPKVIGGLLFLFCLAYLIKNLGGAVLRREDGKGILEYLKSRTFLRLLCAVGFLALYIFVLLPIRIGGFELPYEAATFIYLSANMFVFRTPKFAVWKIIIISAAVSLAIGFCFTHGARIPLP